MRNKLAFYIASLLLISGSATSQCTMTTSIADVTLQCSGGTSNRTGVAFNPNQNLYYSVNAGNSGYPIETFGITGGSPLSTTVQGADYRGIWWNPTISGIEGNTFNSGGLYQHLLAGGTFYASGTATSIASAGMPNSQSMGYGDIANNLVIYYNAGVIHKYTRSTGAFSSSVTISGLPAVTSNLNTYGIVYTGVFGSEAAVYDYVNRCIYFINYNTGAYVSTCQLPIGAPTPGTFRMGFANNRFFLYESTNNQWWGYPILNPAAGPTIVTSASSPTMCSGNNVTITASGAASYTWSSGSNSSAIVVSPSASVVYTVAGTNTLGCSASRTVALSVIQGLTVTPSASPPAICSGQSSTLSNTGSLTYTWSTNQQNSNIVVSPGATSTYSISGTNSTGCVSSAVITVTVNSAVPSLTVTASTVQACLGQTVSVTAQGAITYTWNNGVANSMSFAPTSSSLYIVNGQNGCGTSTAGITVSVAPLPVQMISTPSITCAGKPALLTAVSTATSYAWQPSAATTSTLLVAPVVTSNYSVAVTDGTCMGSGVITLTVNPNPTVNITASAGTVCTSASVTLTASGAGSYSWTQGGSTNTTVVFMPTAPTLYSVTGTNSFGCSTGTTQLVITTSAPSLSPSASQTLVCAGDAVTLTATGNSSTYSWSSGGTASVTVVYPSQNTTYFITGTSSNSCTTVKSLLVNVFTPSVSITGNTAICSGGSTTLTGQGASVYNWEGIGGFQTISVSPSVITTYTMTTSTTSDNVTCNDTSLVTVNVLTNPTPSIITTKTVICKNETATLTASGANNYLWSNSSTLTSITFTAATAGSYTRMVTGTDLNGCIGSAVIQIKVNTCSGIDETYFTDDLLLYPNPSRGTFVVRCETDVQLQIINAAGQLIKTIALDGTNDRTVTVERIASGIYFIVSKDLSVNRKMVVMD
jgi:hypothetical protein